MTITTLEELEKENGKAKGPKTTFKLGVFVKFTLKKNTLLMNVGTKRMMTICLSNLKEGNLSLYFRGSKD